MKREWKPGDVAMVTTRSGREYRAAYVLAPGIDYFWRSLEDEPGNGLTDPDVDARPLVVIDPEDREQVERLADAIDDAESKSCDTPGNADEWARDAVQAALRSLIRRPPRPDEPQGLGAVVEDAEGKRWVRVIQAGGDSTRDDWQPAAYDSLRDGEDLPWTFWADIAAVRILSEGVQP